MACLLLPTQCLNIDDSIYYNKQGKDRKSFCLQLSDQ